MKISVYIADTCKFDCAVKHCYPLCILLTSTSDLSRYRYSSIASPLQGQFSISNIQLKQSLPQNVLSIPSLQPQPPPNHHPHEHLPPTLPLALPPPNPPFFLLLRLPQPHPRRHHAYLPNNHSRSLVFSCPTPMAAIHRKVLLFFPKSGVSNPHCPALRRRSQWLTGATDSHGWFC